MLCESEEEEMRLIDADEIEYTANGCFHPHCKEGNCNNCRHAVVRKGEIDIIATVEAEPVRHGHWKRYDMDIAEHPHHCSCCGWSNYRIDRYVEEFKICPNCGAKMWMV